MGVEGRKRAALNRSEKPVDVGRTGKPAARVAPFKRKNEREWDATVRLHPGASRLSSSVEARLLDASRSSRPRHLVPAGGETRRCGHNRSARKSGNTQS